VHRLRERRRVDPRTSYLVRWAGADTPYVSVRSVVAVIAHDRGELDLLPYLELAWRAQLAHAVGHVGLVGALRRISGGRSAAARMERS
jgi:hypothetical protein